MNQILKKSTALFVCLILLAVCAPQVYADTPAGGNIADASVTLNGDKEFTGMPITPEVSVSMGGKTLKKDVDYALFYERNVNIGTACIKLVGKGNYYGCKIVNFQITEHDTVLYVQGAYNGTTSGLVNDNVYYLEGMLTPGNLKVYIDSSRRLQAVYTLYRLEGETPVQVLQEQTDYLSFALTSFEYDFSSAYESTNPNGYETYMLHYVWADSYNEVYSGIVTMFIPTKVPAAKTMQMMHAEGDGDYKREFLSVTSEDGALDQPVSWTSSNTAVATVADGIVTFQQPGTVTVTAKCGGLTASKQVSAHQVDMSKGEISGFSPATGGIAVYYGGQKLADGTDFTYTVTKEGTVSEPVVTGRKFFTGQLSRKFSASGIAQEQTHAFTDGCDTTCSRCDYIREGFHTMGTVWMRTAQQHYHACTGCGKVGEMEDHTFSPDDPMLCTICGSLNIRGDFNKDYNLNDGDAMYLLRHTLFTSRYPIEQNGDTNTDGTINDADAMYLLRHTLFPERYPLT